MYLYRSLTDLQLEQRGELLPWPDQDMWKRLARSVPQMEAAGFFVLAYECSSAGDPIAFAKVEALAHRRLAN